MYRITVTEENQPTAGDGYYWLARKGSRGRALVSSLIRRSDKDEDGCLDVVRRRGGKFWVVWNGMWVIGPHTHERTARRAAYRFALSH